MKKKIKLISIIIIVNIIIFLIADLCFAYFQHIARIKSYEKMCLETGAKVEERSYWETPFHYTYRYYPFEEYFKEEVDKKERTYGDKSYTKAPIIVFGCSLAEGALLNYDEKFEYYLSEQSKRMVFNYGFGGMGPAPMLYATETNDMYDYINSVTTQQPEYAIYIYIFGHGIRIWNNKYLIDQFDNWQIGYNQRNGKLVHGNTIASFFTRFAIFKYLLSKYISTSPRFWNTENTLIKKYFVQSREELLKRYPNIKFIIIQHPVNEKGRELLNKPNQIWKELEDDGFIIYNIDDHVSIDIADIKYRFPDSHPRKESWQVVVPQLIKDLNL